MTDSEIKDIFKGKKCSCGLNKKRKQPFCSDCYRNLPRDLRTALSETIQFGMIGNGYIGLSRNAAKYLRCLARGQVLCR